MKLWVVIIVSCVKLGEFNFTMHLVLSNYFYYLTRQSCKIGKNKSAVYIVDLKPPNVDTIMDV